MSPWPRDVTTVLRSLLLVFNLWFSQNSFAAQTFTCSCFVLKYLSLFMRETYFKIKLDKMRLSEAVVKNDFGFFSNRVVADKELKLIKVLGTEFSFLIFPISDDIDEQPMNIFIILDQLMNLLLKNVFEIIFKSQGNVFYCAKTPKIFSLL